MKLQMKRIQSAFLWALIIEAILYPRIGSAAMNENPKAIAESYFSGVKERDLEKIESGLSSQVLEAMKSGAVKFTNEVFREAEFILEETVTQGETTIMKVKLIHPLYSFMANTVINGENIEILYEKPFMEEAEQGKDVMVGKQSASIQRQGLPRKKVESHFDLEFILEDGSWKINFKDPMPTIENHLDSIIAIGIRRPEYDDRKYEITLLDGRTYVVDRPKYETLSRKWLMMADKEEATYSADKQVREEVLKEKREAVQKNVRTEYVIHEGPAGNVHNWDRLSKGMSEEAVEQILGPPDSKSAKDVNGQKYNAWQYPKGRVYFYKKKAAKWEAPVARRVRIDPNFKGMEVSEDEIQSRIQAYINAYQPKVPPPLDERMRDGILEAKETIKMMAKYLRIPSSGIQN